MKISIITVCFNSELTIRHAIESVLEQSHTDVEFIVIDGMSNDETMSIINEYKDKVDVVISEPDEGIYDAMNKGVKLATGDIVGILNSDDFYLHKNVLNEVNSAFESDEKLDVVLGDVDFVDASDLKKSVRRYPVGGFKPWMLRFGLMPPHPAVFVRKSAYDRVGLYKNNYQIAADFDFLTRLLLVDCAAYLSSNKHWVRMRTGGASTNGFKSNLVATKELQRSLKENNVYSNYFMLLLRLPYKFFRQVVFK